jgi:Na+-transporting NADH:ubiquinone oxidoreductase subunit B
VHDGLDVSRAMLAFAVALIPCAAFGVVNIGRQALLGADDEGLEELPGWRGALLETLGFGVDPDSLLACAVYGLGWALPIFGVATVTALVWRHVFARARRRPPSEAVPLVALLFALMLPPGLPLWQVALGASFAVVVGLEIFGGTGRNVVNPALAGVAFLYFAYPVSFTGEGAWVALEGSDALAPLAAAAQGGVAALEDLDVGWRQSFLGWEPGALGETSALACLLGAVFLVHVGLASWRVIAGGVLGLAATVLLAALFGGPARPLAELPVHWHLSLGGFAFGLCFLATDPVTSPATAAGRWIHGLLVGALTGLIRIFNPTHVEGVMMAVLLANVLAPLVDRGVIGVHLARRRRRRG